MKRTFKNYLVAIGFVACFGSGTPAQAAGPLSITDPGLGRFLADYDGSSNSTYTIDVYLEPANAGGCAGMTNDEMHEFIADILENLTAELALSSQDVSLLETRLLLQGMTDNTGKPVTYDINGNNFDETVYVMDKDPLNSLKVSNQQTILLYDRDGGITMALNGEDNRCEILGFAGMVFASESTDPEVEKGQMVVNCAAFDPSICPQSGASEQDVITVIKHEFMHMGGADHSQLGRESEDTSQTASDDTKIATMYPRLVSGKEQSTLNKDDIVSLALFYPSTLFSQEFGSISGTVVDGNGALVPCVEVMAENVSNGSDVVSTITGYSAPIDSGGSFPTDCSGDCGTFTLRGLLGNYRLSVRNIREEFDGSSSIGRCKPPIRYDLDGDGKIEDNESSVFGSVTVGKGEVKSNVVIDTASLASTSGGNTTPPQDDAEEVTSVCSLYLMASPSFSDGISSLFFIFTGLMLLATGRQCVSRKP